MLSSLYDVDRNERLQDEPAAVERHQGHSVNYVCQVAAVIIGEIHDFHKNSWLVELEALSRM